MSRLPWIAAWAGPALLVARLLPETGAGLVVRLAAATVVLLVPGVLAARALRVPGAAAALAWAIALLAGALAVTFAVHGSIWLTLGLLLGAGAAALPFSLRGWPWLGPRLARLGVLAAGVGFGIGLWWVAGQIDGDALFHLARVRKLVELGDLHLRTVDEFRDGGLHPGYAFPLWHGFLALVAKLAAVDPSAVVLHEATVLAPLAFLVAFEVGFVLLGSVWGGLAALVVQVGVIGLAPGHGGSYPALALPGTLTRQLLVPAALALFFLALERPRPARLASVAAIALGIVAVHPTYALFLLIPLAAAVVVRVTLVGGELRRGAAAVAAYAIPAGLFSAWLLPLARETVSTDPSAVERRRALAAYAAQLDVFSDTSYRLAPAVFARTGAVAVAALVLVPLAGLARSRRWAALVLGGFVSLLAIELVPVLFVRFSDAVSLSQSRRAAGFVPFAIALAGGLAVLARLVGPLVLPGALAAGIALQLAWPGSFAGARLDGGGPGLTAWIAFVGGAAALLLALVLRRRELRVRAGPLTALAAALFTVPLAVHGFTRWTGLDREGADPLSPGLVAALRAEVPPRAVVWAEPATSYRIAAFAPVYVAVAPPTHVADTRANRPYARYRDAAEFRRTGSLAIPRRYGATWLVVDRLRSGRLRVDLPAVYRDGRYALYRLGG